MANQRKVCIDGKEMEHVISSKQIYTWFKGVDGKNYRVRTYEYGLQRYEKGDVHLTSE